MSHPRPRPRTLRVCPLLAAVLLGAPGAARAGSAGPWPNVDPGLGPDVRAAVAWASGRLEQPACAAVVADFTDVATGRPLTEALAATGQDAAGYLRWITFRSGEGLPACGAANVFAATSPGSRVVFICPRQFLSAQRRDPGFAASIVVHEALHTLGLGEGPPSPHEITQQVEARCGR